MEMRMNSIGKPLEEGMQIKEGLDFIRYRRGHASQHKLAEFTRGDAKGDSEDSGVAALEDSMPESR